MSNFLIVVDLNPIFSTTPSIIPSTAIQSPILNLFSTKTKIPDIKFLNKSCAPSATATPNRPNPAIIGPIFIPHNSRTEAASHGSHGKTRAPNARFAWRGGAENGSKCCGNSS